MSLFKWREVEELGTENKKLRDEILTLNKQKCDKDLKLFNAYGRELLDEIAEKLELTPVQKGKLQMIFSIEHCRIMGVPEKDIIHNLQELEQFFTVGES